MLINLCTQIVNRSNNTAKMNLCDIIIYFLLVIVKAPWYARTIVNYDQWCFN